MRPGCRLAVWGVRARQEAVANPEKSLSSWKALLCYCPSSAEDREGAYPEQEVAAAPVGADYYAPWKGETLMESRITDWKRSEGKL